MNFPISWSKLNTFETCPHKFWLLYGSKHALGKAVIPFETSRALEEGSEKHALMEQTLQSLKQKGCLAAKAEQHKFWQPWWGALAQQCVAKYPQSWVEQKIAVDTKFNKCPLDKYWKPSIDKSQVVLFQGTMDAVFFNGQPFREATKAVLIDWKSGKVRKGPPDQLALMALMLFCTLPKLNDIEAVYVYLDHKKRISHKFKRKELPALKKDFSDRAGKLILAFNEEFEALPGNCHWCPATKEHCYHGRA